MLWTRDACWPQHNTWRWGVSTANPIVDDSALGDAQSVSHEASTPMWWPSVASKTRRPQLIAEPWTSAAGATCPSTPPQPLRRPDRGPADSRVLSHPQRRPFWHTSAPTSERVRSLRRLALSPLLRFSYVLAPARQRWVFDKAVHQTLLSKGYGRGIFDCFW